ncbi:MAG: SusC/RagA family TonB-linked outer membrane protein [Niabella sp.]
MKFAIFLILLTSFHAIAFDASSQQRINLDVKELSIHEIIEKIESKYRYRFVYDDEVTLNTQKLNLYARNATVDYVMQNMLKATAFTYKKINNGLVVIIGKPGEKVSLTIEGIVTDALGNPLTGVSIVEKGTSNGVSSNEDGRYAITVKDENAILVFSIVGYTAKEISVKDNNYTEVALNAIVNKLEEVVVVGYGTQRQKDLTGAVSAITSKDFNQGLVLSPQQSIQGKVTGVNISQNSGKPGGSNTIRIRGGTSLTQSNDPLYVIDGMPISGNAGSGQANINSNAAQNIFDMEPTNPLMTLNPDDIESVTVLKDASATAIYGSRGANGVIVITTKKGSSGTPRVTLNASYGVAKVANTLDVLSADQYRQAAKDYGLTIDDKGANTNWQDEIFRTAHLQDYDLSLSGGGNKTTYRASLGYGDQQSILIGSGLKRTNGRININHSALNDRLTFDLRMNYGQTFSTQSPLSNTVGSEFASSMLYEALVFNPTYTVRDADGNYYFVPPYRVNPVSFSDQVLDQVTNNRFIGSLSTTLKITGPLSVNVNLGYTNQNINRNSYIAKANLLGQGLGGYANVQKLEDYSKLLETVLRYNEKLGSHSIDAIAGYSWQYFLSAGNRTAANGFLSDAFKWYSLQAASTISNASTFQGSNKLISFYARANYSYADRILFTGTVRRDGSSRFGAGNKWGIFPSGSLAWRISNEKFFNLPQVSDLKVRVSYGTTGNQEIGNLNSITTLGATTTGYIVGGKRITTVLPQQYANPNLKWEQTAQLDIGLDFAVFNGRLRGSFDYYNKKTTDLLLRIPVPTPSAISTQLANVGSVQNKGVEINVTGAIIDNTSFGWESNFNISFNKNKVLSLANDQFTGNNIQIAPLQGTVSLGRFAQLVIPGQPLGTFWGPQFTGIADGKETYASNMADTIIGVAQPKFIFGFTNTFTYRRFTLNFLFRGSVGNDVFNLTAANLSYLSNLPGRNVLASALTNGLDRDAPKQYSSRWIEDGTFVRLDNLSLGYNINVKNTFVNSARVFITGQNLLLFTKYSGMDPEVNAEVSGTGTAPLGIDYLSYPRARALSVGINVTF